MKVKMKMPDLGTTEAEIKVVEWLCQPGDRIRRGQPLLEVETDKARMEVESFTSGTVEDLMVPVDTEVVAGDVIAVLRVDDPDGEGGTT